MSGLALPDRARWLLEACLREDGRAVEAFSKWRQFADPERMEGRELRLTPLLHENMRRLGLSDQKLAWIGGQAKHNQSGRQRREGKNGKNGQAHTRFSQVRTAHGGASRPALRSYPSQRVTVVLITFTSQAGHTPSANISAMSGARATVSRAEISSPCPCQ